GGGGAPHVGAAGCGGPPSPPGAGGAADGDPQVAWPPWTGAGADWSQLGADPGGTMTVGATGLGACAPAGGAHVVAIPAGWEGFGAG
ncbi:MAG: hypothetical protein M3003_15115, partial [Candidatus Dormibacteraeota bacterium]|nr:hypothetical protein [Candidatus Dormibacteraeota bacterium]